MNRPVMKTGAVIGIASLAMLAAGPAVAATDHVSQATAQSLQVSVAGNSAVSQLVTAYNDGDQEVTNDASTVPTIASVVPGTNILGAGVAPQLAGAKVDGNGNGHSFACAGIAGTGGGVVKVGDRSCKINGQPLTLDLGNLELGKIVLGNDSALGSALNGIPGINTLLAALGENLDTLVGQISSQLDGTPLGEISLGGSLSAIEAICTADPNGALGTANIVDSSGGSADTPITATLPGQSLTLVNLPANPPPNTHVLVDLDTVTQTLIDGLKQEVTTAVKGALGPLAGPLQTVQDQLITTLVQNLQPALKPLQENVLDITLNKQATSHQGKKIDVTAMDIQVLPAAKQFAGSSLVGAQIGHVTCGPNGRVQAAPTPPKHVTPPKHNPAPAPPKVPTQVNSGLAGDPGHTDLVLGATSALLLVSGGAATMAYRRFRMTQG